MASLSIYLFFFFTKQTSVVLYSFALSKHVNKDILKSSLKFNLVIRIIFLTGDSSTDTQDTYRLNSFHTFEFLVITPAKYKNFHYLLKKENRKVTSAVYFILSKFFQFT